MAKVTIVPPDLTKEEMEQNRKEFESFVISLIEKKFGVIVELESNLAIK